jgi:hypothetical protein
MAALIFGMIVLWLGICMGLSVGAARSARRQRQRQLAVVPVEAHPFHVPQAQG